MRSPLPATPLPPEPLWVGEWQVAPGLNRIARGDVVVQLEPKAMALLTCLAGRAGEVASRDELLAAVWPGVVVGDNALTQAVAKLRKALGDTAREPAYVQAIAKKGYRLVAEVRRSAPSAARSRAAPTAPRPSRRVLLALAAVAAVGVAIGFGWREHAPATATELNAAPAEAALPAIAVRPFVQLGARPGQGDIGRAIGADLITALSKVAGLRVVSGGAADTPPPNTRYALAGSVQQEGDRLRLNVLLTDTTNGQPVWSERFDRRVTDLFAVQDDLVRNILVVLPVKVSEAETRRVAQRNTRNLQAYEQFIRAQAALLVRRPGPNEDARSLYRAAIRLDPSFARAYAGQAMTYALEYQQGWAADRDAALGRAFELAQTAGRIDPDLPEAHWVLGFVHAQRRQHDLALRSLDDALRLSPSYADAYALKAGILTYTGQPAASIELLRQALRLNPDAGSLYFLLLGRAYYFIGDHEQAQLNLNHALGRNAESLEAHLYLAATLQAAGDLAGARWQVDEMRALEPAFDAETWLATYPLTAPDALRQLRTAFAALGIDRHEGSPR